MNKRETDVEIVARATINQRIGRRTNVKWQIGFPTSHTLPAYIAGRLRQKLCTFRKKHETWYKYTLSDADQYS